MIAKFENPYCYIVTKLQCDICMKRRNRPLLGLSAKII